MGYIEHILNESHYFLQKNVRKLEITPEMLGKILGLRKVIVNKLPTREAISLRSGYRTN